MIRGKILRGLSAPSNSLSLLLTGGEGDGGMFGRQAGACHERRQQLLARADTEGLPSDSIQSLSDRLPESSRKNVQASIREAANRSQLLRHQSLTNWVVVQRSLLHLSQLIEIIATGGRPKPTYDKGPGSNSGGSLVDQAA